jgi:hypothetical protein
MSDRYVASRLCLQQLPMPAHNRADKHSVFCVLTCDGVLANDLSKCVKRLDASVLSLCSSNEPEETALNLQQQAKTSRALSCLELDFIVRDCEG